ncbi:MAG TPA: DUF6782 family putative metallopeptidase [Myxococcaceae bacterium]|nr:DUF6782 family putative metallopeptidase [Myxococcaceae bacterium]
MRILRAALVLLAVLAGAAARASDDEELLREAERMARMEGGGAASPEELRALVAEMLPRVGKVMRLPVPARVEVKVISRDQARAALLEVLRRDYPGDLLERLAEALAAVGLVAPGTELRAEAQALYGGNVSGFYDPHQRRLYLLSDQPLAAQALIVAHELAHAVQDEAIRLEATSRKVRASEDAQLALSAAIEGQAQQVAALVLAGDAEAGGDDGLDLGSFLTDAAAASAAMAGGQASVPWLGLQMSFPYASGAALVAAIRTAEDPAATSLLRRLPRSTAQVLDPALYRADERPREARLDLAAHLPGSAVVYATTLGAANLNLFGELHGRGELGRGWRGDRLETVRQGNQLCAAWAVAFSSPAGAERLVKAWGEALGGGAGKPVTQADRSRYLVRQSGSVAVLLENVPAERVAELVSAAAGAFR